MEGLSVPEDDPTPHSPFVTLAQGQLEAFDPDRTAGADALGLGKVGGSFREEELVGAFLTTSSVFVDFSQMIVHFKSLFFSGAQDNQKAAGYPAAPQPKVLIGHIM
jgi:hypothetical protein